jgi:hypothetical protein
VTSIALLNHPKIVTPETGESVILVEVTPDTYVIKTEVESLREERATLQKPMLC